MLIDLAALSKVPRKEGLHREHVVEATPRPAALVTSWGRFFELQRRHVVGRSTADVDLVIRDPIVSMVHAELFYSHSKGAWAVVDRGSTNGTFVDRQRVLEDPLWLQSSQVVEFGDVGFLFVLIDESVVRAQRPSRWR